MSDPLLSKLQPGLLDEFGSSRVQEGIYRLGPLTYAIHLSQASANKPGSAYVSGDMTVYDPETNEEVGKLRMMVGSVADKSKKRVMMAPSKDGDTVAGPPDVNGAMLLELARGGVDWKDEEEEELFSGPFLLQAPSVKKMKGGLTQFNEELKRIIGPEIFEGKRDGRLYEGYVVELGSRPNAYPNKKKKKEGEQEYDDDVLVPVRLIARPGESLPAGLFQQAQAVTQAAIQTGAQIVAGITQAPHPAAVPVAPQTIVSQAPVAQAAASNGAPTPQEIEMAIYQNLPADWASQREYIVPLMNQFPTAMPIVLGLVQNPQWMFSPERALWESDPTKQLIKKRV